MATPNPLPDGTWMFSGKIYEAKNNVLRRFDTAPDGTVSRTVVSPPTGFLDPSYTYPGNGDGSSGPPLAHAASHAEGGSDALTLSMAQITGLAAALLAKATPADVAAAVAGLVGSAPATMDTVQELAAILGNDPNSITTIMTALGNRLRVDTAAQGLNGTQQANARTNLGLGAAALAAAITDLAVGTLADGEYVRRVGAGLVGGTPSGIAASLFDAAGDVLIGTANDTAGKLTRGGHRTVLMSDDNAANKLSWARFIGQFVIQGIDAWYTAINSTSRASVAGTLNSARAIPIPFSNGGTFDKAAMEITSVGTAGAIVRSGVYADDGTGFPGALQVEFPTVDAATSTGVKETTPGSALVLPAGMFYYVVVQQVAISTMRCFSAFPTIGIPHTIGSAFQPNSSGTGWSATISGALPSTFPTAGKALAAGSTFIPILGLHAS